MEMSDGNLSHVGGI